MIVRRARHQHRFVSVFRSCGEIDRGDAERIASVRVRVAENLGLADERLTSGSLQEIAAARFSPDAFVARWSKLFNDLDAKGWD